MIALFLYITALFFIGIGNAIATYHILRYRDPNDASLTVLTLYYVAVGTVIVFTAFGLDWSQLFTGNPIFQS